MRERNYGIDFLRMLAMFMIVVLHTLGKGGLLDTVQDFSGHYWVVWILELASYCAVNCYALISGYVMHRSSTKLSKILELWLQIAFYMLGITFVMLLVFPEMRGWKHIINALFPISRGQYWYLSAYFGMYIFVPLLNAAIEKVERNVLRNALFAVFIMMSVLGTGLRADAYYLNDGYSVLWLCILYLAGAYIGKYQVFEKAKRSTLLLLYVGAVGITVLSKALPQLDLRYMMGEPTGRGMLVSYTAPTIVLAGLFLFGFCTKLKFGKTAKKLIAFFAPTSLGIYIIHTQPLIWEKFVAGFAAPFHNSNFVVMGGKIIISAFAIWLVCALIERCRIGLFRFIKVKEMCRRMEKGIHMLWFKCCEKRGNLL